MTIDVGHLLASFGGGIIGAAIGGLNSFIMTGILVLAGVAAGFFDQPQAGAILNSVAFGPMFGPHIAFAGGVAAAAYASEKRLDVNAKDIGVPLVKLNRPDVLVIGGVFGVIGYLLNTLWVSMALKTDTIALTVTLSNMLARGLFCKEGPFGTLTDDLKNKGFVGRFVIKEGYCWLPWQKDFMQLFVIGLGFGLPSGVVGVATGQPVLAFGIAGAYLIFLAHKPGFPVVHHVMLPAALAAHATGSVLMGGVFGILGALLGELAARLFYNYGKSHIDPPAVAIAILTTIILFL
ncbi:MAG: hypothetical protein L5655_10360 [Thermosediminibacteraceae bacterium]|nr:hypothetical protein [Thermosediminibacteraceae bacterium]